MQDLYNAPVITSLPNIALFFNTVFPYSPSFPSAEEILTTPLNNPRQQTIRMDVHRTRSHHLSTEEQRILQIGLTWYCKKGKFQYKQGLNQVMAPFMILSRAGLQINQWLDLFCQFFQRQGLNFYHDQVTINLWQQFRSLSVFFKMLMIVVKYHDPALARYLETHEIEPQIFCLGWLMTLFANKLSLDLTYTLWQLLILEQDPYFIFYLVVGIILSHKSEIIQSRNSSIYSVITDMLFKEGNQLQKVVGIGLFVRKSTPASLMGLMKERQVWSRKDGYGEVELLMKKMQELNLFLVLPTQISLRRHLQFGLCPNLSCFYCLLSRPISLPSQLPVQALASTFPALISLLQLASDIRTMPNTLQFVIIDVRAGGGNVKMQIAGINLYKIDINQKIQKIQQEFIRKFMQERGRQHFVFLLTQFSFQNTAVSVPLELQVTKSLISLLNSYSFPFLSILQGGESSLQVFQTNLQNKSLLMMTWSRVQRQEQRNEVTSSGKISQLVGRDGKWKVSDVMAFEQEFYHKKIQAFAGEGSSSHQILLVCPSYILILSSTASVLQLLNRLEHSNSMRDYFLLGLPSIVSRFQVPIHLTKANKISVKMHKQSMIVISVVSEAMWWKNKSIGELMKEETWEEAIPAQQINKIGQGQYQQESSSKKVFFELKNIQQVKECAKLIKNNYIKLIKMKRHQEEKQKKQSQKQRELNEQLFSKQNDLNASQSKESI